MIVRSNKITAGDIIAAVRSVSDVAFLDTFSQEGWYVPIRQFSPRNHNFGYEFFLEGTGTRHVHASAHDGTCKAATWTDWGVVIAYLYKIDPSASIGMYKDRHHFLEWTEKVAQFQEKEAPWLQ
jgi:hypothetical protein